MDRAYRLKLTATAMLLVVVGFQLAELRHRITEAPPPRVRQRGITARHPTQGGAASPSAR